MKDSSWTKVLLLLHLWDFDCPFKIINYHPKWLKFQPHFWGGSFEEQSSYDKLNPTRIFIGSYAWFHMITWILHAFFHWFLLLTSYTELNRTRFFIGSHFWRHMISWILHAFLWFLLVIYLRTDAWVTSLSTTFCVFIIQNKSIPCCHGSVE